MKISDILKEDKVTLTYEVFPPRAGDSYESVAEKARAIAELRPAFMSVTYGAGGGRSAYTVELASDISRRFGVESLAHLTCVSSTREQVARVLAELKAHGVENILALRGDIPLEGPACEDYKYAPELVRDIKAQGDFCVGGACYPEGHPEAGGKINDIQHLKEKVEAGCEFLITQMFFDNSIFYNFLYRIREQGIEVPVIAGIMPVTNAKQVKRITQLSGNYLPEKFKAVVDRFGSDPAAMRQAGVANPLMLLDEIDKVSGDYKGDVASALLEVLDGEQNVKFRDHYVEIPLDLSGVLFIATANTTQTIPGPLLDRMEVIEVSSYTENEKFHIARDYLVTKQMERNGLKEGQITFSDKSLEKIIHNYTREAGVRNLERRIGDVCRKAARQFLEDKKKSIKITESNLEKYLGKEKVTFENANEEDEIGIVRGLAWTSVGGDTLQIEVNVMPGKGSLLMTGQLGDVMKESAQTALTYVRSVCPEYGIADDYFEKHDLHIHIPEGAVPKDGPSAGITMATAMLSAVTGKSVQSKVAMTGEITLRGRVLPIGGLKEKILAAKMAHIEKVLVPDKNRPDMAELSKEITRGLDIVYVKAMEDVVSEAFV